MLTSAQGYNASPEQITDMRYWLIDCNADPDTVELASDAEILREVERHCEGGVRGFILAGE
jgi:hypothetical protein